MDKRWGLGLLLAASALAAAAGGIAGDTAGELTRTVEALDQAAFDAYNRCELDKFGAMFDRDVEFYHDKGGLMVSRQAVVEATQKYICGKVRRELVAGTMEVYAMDGYGAVQLGSHRFCELATQRCEGVAKFMHLWRQREGAWQITRVISYDHQPLAVPTSAVKQP
ncbi:MAG TPA: nuclear transport factor 2 family protein [Ideonella sp.]|nr:nuclear transport factor 2 family protein [Ideonella sp.]